MNETSRPSGVPFLKMDIELANGLDRASKGDGKMPELSN